MTTRAAKDAKSSPSSGGPETKDRAQGTVAPKTDAPASAAPASAAPASAAPASAAPASAAPASAAPASAAPASAAPASAAPASAAPISTASSAAAVVTAPVTPSGPIAAKPAAALFEKESKEPVAPPTTPRVAPSTGSLLGEVDLHCFNEGTHTRLYEHMGAHPMVDREGRPGTYFAVWAPNAEAVSVIGDFNRWRPDENALTIRSFDSGIWEGFVEGVATGAIYKYHVKSRQSDYQAEKADPLAFYAEVPPRSASVVWSSQYAWRDDEWMEKRIRHNRIDAPVSIYEIHLGSWRRVPEENNRWLTYRELAEHLASYCVEMGFTHVELMPCTEFPFDGSWGYQTTGYFAPTSRFGTPDDFKFMVDHLHQNGIGVILDWVPSHFPSDGHGLAYFDGTHLYEHADPRQGYHPDWASLIFNYGRNEVRSFLISSACMWLEQFHVDGIRVDAVASMLYLDYSRKEGEWIPNKYGGRENIEALEFIRQLNSTIGKQYPGVLTIAEESTAWGMVSRPPEIGGLGFHLKWDMGWMHDTLKYMSLDPVHRKYHHHELTFRMLYYANENFVLPLSHDEVVHGKGSLYGKMPGDDWQKHANLRLLYGYMYGQPGKKLLFMGGEFGQWPEWKHNESLEWHALDYAPHQGLKHWVKDLNHLYRQEPALFEGDCEPQGFEWIDCNDWEHSMLSFMRVSKSGDAVVFVLNFTPVPRDHYQVGLPTGGHWRVVLNSDAEVYGGSNYPAGTGQDAQPIPTHGRNYSMTINVPPLAVVVLRPDNSSKA
ncbi:MAG: 1,4-alpha-glucan branching protein GlgB [Deltaproteobacteria bacterium]|nr:1,4-alpha-glucan branching protein GlgB [Deltaproteobacteria bacterium]